MGIEQDSAWGGYKPLGREGLERDDDSAVFTGDFMFADSPAVSKRKRVGGETASSPKWADGIWYNNMHGPGYRPDYLRCKGKTGLRSCPSNFSF